MHTPNLQKLDIDSALHTDNVIMDDMFFCAVRPKLLLNPFLATFTWDMRAEPVVTPEWNQPATYPQLSRIHVMSPHFEWHIHIISDPDFPKSITCGDMIMAIRTMLHEHLVSTDVKGVSEEQLAAMSEAHEDDQSANADMDEENPYKGMMRRVDWLCGQSQYAGLTYDPNFLKERLGYEDPRMLVLHCTRPPIEEKEIVESPPTVDVEILSDSIGKTAHSSFASDPRPSNAKDLEDRSAGNAGRAFPKKGRGSRGRR